MTRTFLSWIVIVGALLAGTAYAAVRFDLPRLIAPCQTPITYVANGYDARFGISEAEYKKALLDAAAVWNEAAGKTLLVEGDEGVEVKLVYGDIQETTELGEVIDDEQSAYDAKKTEVESLRARFFTEKERYETLSANYTKDSTAYEEDVEYWNARGGAPAKEYEELQQRQQRLKQQQDRVNAQADTVNALADQINERVAELNALAGRLNNKVNTYNRAIDDEFDQGEYVSDADGKRIDIYSFADRTELRRVLIHEFGHAIGLEHVENPASIMYSYNIGTSLTLSAEDKAELARVCRF